MRLSLTPLRFHPSHRISSARRRRSPANPQQYDIMRRLLLHGASLAEHASPQLLAYGAFLVIY